MPSLRRPGVALAALLLATPAAAHHPTGGMVPDTPWLGLLSGLGHPLLGPDHLAFLLAAGMGFAAARLSPRWIGVFVAGSTVGVLALWRGMVLPGVEWLVAASVLLAALLLAVRAPRAAAWPWLLALGGVAHGQAFGEAIAGAGPAPVLAYLIGLGAMQALVVAGAAAVFGRLAAGSLPARRLAAVILGGVVVVRMAVLA